VKKIKDLDAKVVVDKWIEFKELIELKREDTTRGSQGGSQHTIAMVENSTAKRPLKEEIEVKKKEKILGKIIMGKEAKGFDLVECHIKDTTIGEEYANLFPLGFTPVEGVNLPINYFKRSPPEIVYLTLSKKHVNEINTQIIVYNKFDTKVPIFTIPEGPERPNYILPRCLKKWEDIQNFQFLIING
jgi:hypothetical protein